MASWYYAVSVIQTFALYFPYCLLVLRFMPCMYLNTCHHRTHIGKCTGSDMVPFEWATVVSYRLCIVTSDHCTISNHSATICDQMSPTLESTWVCQFWAKFREEGVDWFLTRSGRNMGLTYAKEIVSISSVVWVQCTNMTDKQTDRPRNGNIDLNKRNCLSAMLPKIHQWLE